jgi:hypothetical protein
MASASWIEHRATRRALVGALQVLSDGQFRSTSPAQDRTLVPLRLWPDFNCMTR